ncbi:plasmid pRiA4b ORF-3 family protein [Arthrobacter sp. lap29]|uniref:plasmid pRiA4b ORF-3 family protein n=1 Tax=Arthrobacter sp. lap29 TaxID=3056122 RepID=UPI0028F73C8A|nr:plasmid pRiA4b ORF-3 family protein [Arthrobacter sp. lap29]
MAKKTDRSAKDSKMTSVGELRASRAVDAVVPAFVQWCQDSHGMPADAAMEYLNPVKDVAAAYFELVPSSVATAFDAEPFGTVLGKVYAAYDNASTGSDNAVMFVFEAVHLYVEFLERAGMWTGTEAEYDAVHSLFHVSEENAGAQLEVPQLTANDELAFYEGTELVHYLENFLHWLGKGREVTSTGLLRLKEIEGAASAIGLRARGGRPLRDQRWEKPSRDPNQPDAEVYAVLSMNGLDELMKFWVTLEACHLVQVGPTRVRPTAFAEELLETGHPGRLGILRSFVSKFLEISVHGESHWSMLFQDVALVQSILLLDICHPGGFTMDYIPELVANIGLKAVDPIIDIVTERTHEMARLGLLTLEPVIQVLPPLVPFIPSLLEYAKNRPEGDDEWEGLAGIDAIGGPAPKASPQTRLLQVKIMLKDSKPPVWRRLLVRNDLNLAQLHHIIQRAFGWMNCHLHEFRVGGYNGTAYGPVGDDFDFGDQMPIDEASIKVGQILSQEKDKIGYTYDFGDNWEHSIAVENVLEYRGGPAARCTGGRGAGPAEDSGGVWGWENIGAIMTQPTHPEYQEYRDWLGIEEGEAFDPKSFDEDGVDEILSELF